MNIEEHDTIIHKIVLITSLRIPIESLAYTTNRADHVRCIYLTTVLNLCKTPENAGIVGSPPKHFGDWCSHTSVS